MLFSIIFVVKFRNLAIAHVVITCLLNPHFQYQWKKDTIKILNIGTYISEQTV